MSNQIKSKKRVADFGEVYTAKKQVNDMLDLIPDDISFDATYLEPACGNGNFLVAIMKRKLYKVFSLNVDTTHNIIKAVSSVYGVDIQADNVEESRNRLKGMILETCDRFNRAEINFNVLKAIDKILERNIVCGNTLTGLKADDTPLVFCEWEIKQSGYIICKEVRYNDLIISGGECNDYIAKHRYNWIVKLKQEKERHIA